MNILNSILRNSIICTLIILLSYVYISKAQNAGIWNSIGPRIENPSISDIIVDPQNPRNLFAGTHGLGIYRSDDFGLSWNKPNATFPNANITVLTSYNGKFYAGTHNNGILWSDDGGNTWSKAEVPTSDSTINVILSSEGDIWAGTNNGLLCSIDMGKKWGNCNSFPNNIKVNCLLFVNNNLYVGTEANGLFLSSDRGKSWNQIPNLKDKTILVLAYFFDRLFVGTNTYDIFYKENNGSSWEKAQIGSCFLNQTATQTFQPSDLCESIQTIIQVGEYLFVSTMNKCVGSSSGGVYRSDNKGGLWCKYFDRYNITSLASHGNRIYVGTFPPHEFEEFLPPTGIFISEDLGRTWVRANSPLNDKSVGKIVIHEGTIYAGTGSGVYRSIDNGINWGQNNLFSITASDQIVVTKNYIFTLSGKVFHPIGVFGGDDIYGSLDGGLNWKRVSVPTGFSALLGKGSRVFAGTPQFGPLGNVIRSEGLLYTKDWGNSWIPSLSIDKTTENNFDIAKLFCVGNTIFATTSRSSGVGGKDLESGLFFSNDDGTSWSESEFPIHNGPFAPPINTMLSSADLYFAGTSFGLLLSSNKGASWSPVDAPMNSEDVRALLYYNNRLYSGTFANGLFFSDNNGKSWTKAKAPLDTGSITKIVPYNNGAIIVGTNDNGIFVSSNQGIDWVQARPPLNDKSVTDIIEVANVILVGTVVNGVYKSGDGLNWVPLKLGMGDKSITALAPIPELLRVYAATSNGIYSHDLDLIPPVADSIRLGTNTNITPTRIISLNLFVRRNEADSMIIAEDQNFVVNSTNWQEYKQIYNYKLTSGDGLKVIYAKFKDTSYNISNIVNTKIKLDTTSPSFLNHTSPPLPSIGNTVIVSQKVLDENLNNLFMDYRRGGETWSQNRRSFFERDTATIDGVFITNRGLDYRITAKDLAGNDSTLQNRTFPFFSLPVKLDRDDLGSSPSFPGGTKGSAYRLISIPMKLDGSPNVKAVLGNLGEYGEKGGWRFWQYQSNGQWIEGENLKFKNGEAFFIILRNGGSFTNKVSGTTMPTTAGLTKEIPGWHLRANNKWNIIGNPYKTTIDLAQLKLSRQGFILSEHDALEQLEIWAYDGSATQSGWTKEEIALKPWSGLAIWVTEADTIVFANKDDPYAPVPAKRSSSPLFFTQNLQEDEWVFKITAESEGHVDEFNYFGVKKDASETQDRYEWLEPPLAPGGISVSFPHLDWSIPTNLATDFRATHEPGHIWLARLMGRNGEMTKVRFESTGKIPDDIQIYLIDEDTQITSDLKKKSEFAFRVQEHKGFKPLRIVAGMPEFIEREIGSVKRIPDRFALHQNYPNPFNPSTVIRYELPFSGKVTLKLFNVMGHEVITPQDGKFHEPGYYEQVLDMNDFASGVYFYKIAVEGENKFQQTRKLVFTK